MPKKEDQIINWLKETDTHLMYDSKKNGEGLKAITNYKVVKESAKYSLLDVTIETGRKNQIRVHMQELGHPIIGDFLYNPDFTYCNRQALHSYSLSFIHPITKKEMHLHLFF